MSAVRLGVILKDFSVIWSLFKPRVVLLVAFTAAVGLIVAPYNMGVFLTLLSIFCVCLGAGGASCINMWYDQDIDMLMKRTSNRPIPKGVISSDFVLILGTISCFVSVYVMAVFFNFLSAILLLSAILFYVLIYTMWLKRTTVQNIVIGGGVGVFPPIIGWSSVTDSIDLFPVILGAIVFFWNPPHFWSLSIFRIDDYRSSQVPMMPVIYGINRTKKEMLFYTILMLICSFIPYFSSFLGEIYLVFAIILGGGFLLLSYKIMLCKESNREIFYAKFLFFYSIFYLFFLFLAVSFDTMLELAVF